MALGAVVFDVDGTLADTQHDGHGPAFNQAFAEFGLDHLWDAETYGQMLAVTGGLRRIEGFLAEQGHSDPAGFARELHRVKTSHFLAWVLTGPVRCRPGVDDLIADLRGRGVAVGVATTGRRAWVYPLLDRLFGLDAFSAVVTGDDVERLKPAPDAHELAMRRVGLDHRSVLAVEDSPVGLAAARAAGLACVVVTNDHTRRAPFPGAAAVLDGYDGLDVDRCASLISAPRTGDGPRTAVYGCRSTGRTAATTGRPRTARPVAPQRPRGRRDPCRRRARR